jgi:hypothetical protein
MQPQVFVQTQVLPQLGMLINTYTSSKVGAVLTAIIGFVFAIGGIILCVTLPIFSSDITSTGLFVVFGLAAIGGGFYMLYRAWNNAAINVHVYTDGLISITRQGTDIFPWNQIATTWQQVTKNYTNGIYSGTTHVYIIQRRDGLKAVFNDAIGKVESLGDTIRQETLKYLVPQALEAFAAGQQLYFGKLLISQQGISNGVETVPWSEVKSVSLNNGVITVSREGKWLAWSNVSVSQTPNVFIFLALVDQIKGLRR